MCPPGLTQTLNKQIKSSQNQVPNFSLYYKIHCPFYSLTFTHLEGYGFVYSLSRYKPDSIHSTSSHLWTRVLLIHLLTHHFGDVNLGFCCTLVSLMEFRVHLTEENRRQPCHHGYLIAQLWYFQHPVAQNLCYDKTNTYIFVETLHTLQFKETQTHLRCAWLWLRSLKLCDCISIRHGWNIALTGVRQLYSCEIHVLKWWKLIITGCSDVLSSYNQRNKLHYFVGNRKVLMKRLNTSISLFKENHFSAGTGGWGRSSSSADGDWRSQSTGLCFGPFRVSGWYSVQATTPKTRKKQSRVHSWPTCSSGINRQLNSW